MRIRISILAGMALLTACSPQPGATSENGPGKADRSTPSPMTSTLDIARLFAAPDLNGAPPKKVRISPDSKRVTFLRPKATDPLQMDLWEYNIADKTARLLVDSAVLLAGKEQLSLEELARRERLRIVGQHGIVDYQFAPDGNRLLFPLGGDLYLYDLRNGKTRRLTETAAGEIDPKFSSTGRYVSFVRDDNLFVMDLDGFEERQLTKDGGNLIHNGLADFIAQEEMDRYTGYWWAPDDSAIAFMQVDESPVRIAERFEFYADELKVYKQRYPATGTPNARVRLGVVTPAGTDLRWMDTGKDPDVYLARVAWFPGSDFLAVQRESRDQKRLDLLKTSAGSGSSSVLLTETSDTWINLHNDLRFLESAPRFIWKSERSGHAHLYLYDDDGGLIRPITSGDWDVVADGRTRSALLHVDEDQKILNFTATLDSPAEQNVYAVSYENPGPPTRVTPQSGWHDAEFAPSGEFFVDEYQALDTPPQLSLHRADGARIAFIAENRLDQTHPYYPYLASRPTIDIGTLKAADGTKLYYRIMKPADFYPGRRYPAIVFVYGGPHGQLVRNIWVTGFNEILARNGFIVFTLDNRGTSFRGVAFDAPILGRFGNVEVEDQMVGVRYLQSLPFVDAGHIGVWGWSFGGYMTLMCLFREPDTFAAGVAGAPVTDWTLYDTHYTERYLGTPQDNPDGYEASSVFPYVKNLKAPLLVLHGMADDNVLFTNSTKLFSALQHDELQFEMMTYPGSKHSLIVVPTTGRHAYTDILRFFREHLQ